MPFKISDAIHTEATRHAGLATPSQGRTRFAPGHRLMVILFSVLSLTAYVTRSRNVTSDRAHAMQRKKEKNKAPACILGLGFHFPWAFG